MSTPSGFEALLGCLPGDAELVADLGPGVSLGACSGDGGGEGSVRLLGCGVGLGEPGEDVEGWGCGQWGGGVAFAEGGALLGAGRGTG